MKEILATLIFKVQRILEKYATFHHNVNTLMIRLYVMEVNVGVLHNTLFLITALAVLNVSNLEISLVLIDHLHISEFDSK